MERRPCPTCGKLFPSDGTCSCGYSAFSGDPDKTKKEWKPSLHDYFMAHAPAEPQQWFKDIKAGNRKAVLPDGELIKRIREHIVDLASIRELLEAFVAARTKRSMAPLNKFKSISRGYSGAVGVLEEQFNILVHDEGDLYLEWPAAWADEMLKRRRV